MGTPRSIAAVVVTYNRADVLPRCLDAILGQEGASADCVLVLDNGSTDNTPEVLAGYSDRGVVRLDAGANTGSAGGFHLGVYEAVMRGYDLVWIMDDDVVPDPGALAALLDADRELGGDWGFLSSVARWSDDTPCRPNVQKKGLFTFVGEEDYAKPLVRVRIAAMASLMLRAEVVREVGLPMAEYFFYTDDYEYTWRSSEGHPSYMVTGSTVLHAMPRNEKPDLATDSDDRMWRYRYLYRNDAHFYRRLGPMGWAYLMAKTGYTTAKVVLKGSPGSRGERLRVLWSGLVGGLGFDPELVEMAHPRRRRVLFFQEAWGRAGIETFVMNVVRGLDPKRYAFEVWSAYDWDDGYDTEIETLGGTRYACFRGEMPGHARRLLAGARAWNKRLSRGDVDVAHVNAMDSTTLVYAALARVHDVPVRVVHSHNSSFAGGMRVLKGVVHIAFRELFGGVATVRLACSRAAGEYMFGRRAFEFMPNGIDVRRFAFDSESRVKTREELGVGDETLLVGSVGRLSYQKNPLFSVRVLADLLAAGAEARLLLVGDGELEGEVASLAMRLGVADRFIHVESIPDPERYYCALDVFLMPSVFEGFGYTLLEAQCSGLPCIVSEAIQDEVCVTNLIKRVPLSEGASAWASAAVSLESRDDERNAYSVSVAIAGYSVEASVFAMREVYSTL